MDAWRGCSRFSRGGAAVASTPMSLERQACRRRVCRRLLSGRNQPGDRLSYRHDVAFLRLDTGKDAIRGRFDFNNSLIGFDFEEDLAFRDGFAFFLDPRNDFSGFLRHLQRRHHNANSHSC